MGVKNCGKHHKPYDHIENNLRHHCLNYQFCSNQGVPREQGYIDLFFLGDGYSSSDEKLCNFYSFMHLIKLIVLILIDSPRNG